MNEKLIDLWQKEAVRFETSVHQTMTRVYAIVGVGLTAIASALIGMFVSKRVEVVLLVPFVLLVLLPIVLITVQEVLVKALYQFKAETELARILQAGADPRSYPTWEDLGGRIGSTAGTTRVFWVSTSALASFLGAGSVAFFLVKGGLARLFPITDQNVFLTTAILVAGAGSLIVLIAVVRSFRMMFRDYVSIKTEFGYAPGLSIQHALGSLNSTSGGAVEAAGLVPHAQSPINGDDGA